MKIVLGPAADSLAKLPSEPKFDLAFIDADKPSNLTYLLEAERLVRKGGVIVCSSLSDYLSIVMNHSVGRRQCRAPCRGASEDRET